MVLPIKKYGSPLLRAYSTELCEIKESLQLTNDLMESLKNAGGIGLAAPQIGILKRAFVIDTSPLMVDDTSAKLHQQVYLNPQILWRSDDDIYFNEGCLSIPDIFAEVLRPQKIKVTYWDVDFNCHQEELDGLIGRIFQHEYDHLEGILFVDKLSALQRRLLSKKLKRIMNSAERR